MKYVYALLQIGFISALSLIGQWLSITFHLPLPGNLLGMFILFFLLLSGLVKESHIALGGDVLLKYMAFFFIPAGVGLLAHLELLSSVWLQWLILLSTTTVIVMGATAKVVDLLIKRSGELK